MSALPGSMAAMLATAGALGRAAGRAHGVGDRVRATRTVAWQGTAADAFRLRAASGADSADTVGDLLAAAERILGAYARDHAELEAQAARAAAQRHTAAAAVRADPLDLVSALHALDAHRRLVGLQARAQERARSAAQELIGLVGEDGWGQSWWDPFGWFDDESIPDRGVDDDILEDGSFEPSSVSQGQIGDCYLLASVMALLDSPEGDQWIRDHIRWDDDKDGYWVTLFVDGKPQEVFVDNVYDQGAAESDWKFLFLSGDKPSIASLYEAAAANLDGYDSIDGGVPGEAMGLLTGIEGFAFEYTSQGYAPYLEHLREHVADGSQMVASTDTEHLGSDSYRVQATKVREDGTTYTEDVTIVDSHAYLVHSVEADGSMWVMNPWGEGNGADGGGLFRLSAEDAGKVFYKITVGALP